ncbi:MAG TPA: hypothetical protein VG028_13430 [Terriglobia bacterium]|nr:hypothetical protein [Terriglobia bacterium]
MKSKLLSVLLGASLLAGLSGCMTRKVTSTNVTGDAVTGFTTNTVTITQVNTNNLILDSAVFQGAVAIGVTAAISATHQDPGVISALKNAQTALDGVLNGSNPETTAQVLTMLKANGNPALVQEINSLIASASALEQDLLVKYGAGVAGQITTALARAADAGLVVALEGH